VLPKGRKLRAKVPEIRHGAEKARITCVTLASNKPFKSTTDSHIGQDMASKLSVVTPRTGIDAPAA
jgi:hypothetical protein